MILVWNARGAASKAFSHALKELCKHWKLVIVVLVETRCSGARAQEVIWRLGFRNQVIEEAAGMSGGIWILWNNQSVKISVLAQSNQFIHCLVTGMGPNPWCFTAVYGSPREHERKRLWDNLWEVSMHCPLPWLLAGDFNDIQDPSEQKGGGTVNESKCQKFLDNINHCKLIDMGSEGPRYTWRGPLTNHASRLYKKLDRGLCNADWRVEFPEVVVIVGARVQSDHHPLIVSLKGGQASRGERPFRFEAAWMRHADFQRLIKDSWPVDGFTGDNLAMMETTLKDWNRDVFGNVMKKKREIIGRLKGI